MSKITVVWEVNDGYMGPSRPQRFSVDIDDLVWAVSGDLETPSREEVEVVINDIVRSEFMEIVSYEIKNLDDLVEAVIEASKEQQNIVYDEDIET